MREIKRIERETWLERKVEKEILVVKREPHRDR